METGSRGLNPHPQGASWDGEALTSDPGDWRLQLSRTETEEPAAHSGRAWSSLQLPVLTRLAGHRGPWGEPGVSLWCRLGSGRAGEAGRSLGSLDRVGDGRRSCTQFNADSWAGAEATAVSLGLCPRAAGLLAVPAGHLAQQFPCSRSRTQSPTWDAVCSQPEAPGPRKRGVQGWAGTGQQGQASGTWSSLGARKQERLQTHTVRWVVGVRGAQEPARRVPVARAEQCNTPRPRTTTQSKAPVSRVTRVDHGEPWRSRPSRGGLAGLAEGRHGAPGSPHRAALTEQPSRRCRGQSSRRQPRGERSAAAHSQTPQSRSPGSASDHPAVSTTHSTTTRDHAPST